MVLHTEGPCRRDVCIAETPDTDADRSSWKGYQCIIGFFGRRPQAGETRAAVAAASTLHLPLAPLVEGLWDCGLCRPTYPGRLRVAGTGT